MVCQYPSMLELCASFVRLRPWPLSLVRGVLGKRGILILGRPSAQAYKHAVLLCLKTTQENIVELELKVTNTRALLVLHHYLSVMKQAEHMEVYARLL